MKLPMLKTTTLYRITISNVLLLIFYFVILNKATNNTVILFYFGANASLFFILYTAMKSCMLINRKKSFFIILMAGSVMLASAAIIFKAHPLYFLLINFIWIVIVYSARKFINTTARTIYKKLNKHMRIAIIGYNDTAAELANRLKKKAKYSFEGFFDNNQEVSFVNQPGYLEPFEYYLEEAKYKKVTDLYISSFQNADEFEAFARKAENYCIRVNLINARENSCTNLYKTYLVTGMPVLRRYQEPLRQLRNRIIKRAFDIIVSSFVIIFILSWLIPLVGLIIKIDSSGPVFFKQLRSGRDNNAFICFKFRSMKKNSETDIQQASKKDYRITRVGAFLRRTSIDEFPQFINVFKGDMSITGPRPHMLLHTVEYSKWINNYMVRLFLKPGITGWAQAKGYRGEVTNIELMKKRVEHDIWYLEHWSFWLDIKILWMTFLTILREEGNAY